MRRNRRKFLAYAGLAGGLVIGGAAWWLRASQGRPARLARRLLDDTRRQVLPAPVTPNPST